MLLRYPLDFQVCRRCRGPFRRIAGINTNLHCCRLTSVVMAGRARHGRIMPWPPRKNPTKNHRRKKDRPPARCAATRKSAIIQPRISWGFFVRRRRVSRSAPAAGPPNGPDATTNMFTGDRRATIGSCTTGSFRGCVGSIPRPRTPPDRGDRPGGWSGATGTYTPLFSPDGHGHPHRYKNTAQSVAIMIALLAWRMPAPRPWGGRLQRPEWSGCPRPSGRTLGLPWRSYRLSSGLRYGFPDGFKRARREGRSPTSR